jgi:hypothetical protein
MPIIKEWNKWITTNGIESFSLFPEKSPLKGFSANQYGILSPYILRIDISISSDASAGTLFGVVRIAQEMGLVTRQHPAYPYYFFLLRGGPAKLNRIET